MLNLDPFESTLIRNRFAGVPVATIGEIPEMPEAPESRFRFAVFSAGRAVDSGCKAEELEADGRFLRNWAVDVGSITERMELGVGGRSFRRDVIPNLEDDWSPVF